MINKICLLSSDFDYVISKIWKIIIMVIGIKKTGINKITTDQDALIYYWLTHCDLVTLYGDIDPGQHWIRQWLVAAQQAIAWTNIDFS